MRAGRAADTARRGRHAKDGPGRRVLILDPDRARPNTPAWHFLSRQSRECGRGCIEVIDTESRREITISEDLCAACLTRAKRCPSGAVRVVNLPSNLNTDTTHRYGVNSFKLHGLPVPRPGHVLGILGCNGTGKSTAVNVLSGVLKPNLGVGAWTDRNGETPAPPTWDDIVKYYRGSDLQNYFTHLIEGRLRCVTKPQLEPSVVQQWAGSTVGDVLRERDERGVLDSTAQKLELTHLMDRKVADLSGGELQRFAVCACVIRDAEVYLFDEMSSFLDVRQRLLVTDVIRSLVDAGTYHTDGRDLANARQEANSKYVIVVEHDLTVLDYVSDYVCCLYGEPGAYGVVTKRSTTARGINQFLAGYFPTENVRFRSEALTFQISVQDTQALEEITAADPAADGRQGKHVYPSMSKVLKSKREGTNSSFTLHVEGGHFRDGEVIGMLGQNGTGKTTFMKMLAGLLNEGETAGKEDDATAKDNTAGSSLKGLGVSYKRQHLGDRYRKFPGTVQEFLERHIQTGLADRMFRLLVMRPLMIDKMEDLPVRSLSGGELQRLAVCVCLGTSARVYLIDEPSAGLDCEQRLIVAKVIKRWVSSHLGAAAFVIEHDMIMAAALYDRVVVYHGSPGVECTAGTPQAPVDGFNAFLRQLGVTFKRDPHNHRPRINKRGSRLDREQKAVGNYYSLDAVPEESEYCE